MDQQTNIPECSFCGKTFEGPNPGVAGPDVFICRDCIGLCIEVMATDAPEWLLQKVAETEISVSGKQP